jgi:formate dehydrogenase major subunit
MVEIEGERVLAPACCRQPTEGMNVQSTSDKALRSQSLVLELLKGEVGPARHSPVSELEYWCESRGLSESRFGGRTQVDIVDADTGPPNDFQVRRGGVKSHQSS